jgi:NNMT/PNMT/TEMT family
MSDTLDKQAANVRISAKLLAVLRRPVTNDEADWNRFASDWYYAHNYASLRDDDLQIVTKIRDFFTDAGVHNVRGIDVGAGTNLYPTLAMLPFCRRIELHEYSRTNVDWLKRNTRALDSRWQQFWEVYAQRPEYAAITDPGRRVRKLTRVRQASVFDLPTRSATSSRWRLWRPRRRYGVGTMCFLACSLSTDMAEFTKAVEAFIGSLKPGAPFAATFMERSEGYLVDGVMYPAVNIDPEDVQAVLAPLTYSLRINRITTSKPLREGYDGFMILATGRVRKQRLPVA